MMIKRILEPFYPADEKAYSISQQSISPSAHQRGWERAPGWAPRRKALGAIWGGLRMDWKGFRGDGGGVLGGVRGAYPQRSQWDDAGRRIVRTRDPETHSLVQGGYNGTIGGVGEGPSFYTPLIHTYGVQAQSVVGVSSTRFESHFE